MLKVNFEIRRTSLVNHYAWRAKVYDTLNNPMQISWGARALQMHQLCYELKRFLFDLSQEFDLTGVDVTTNSKELFETARHHSGKPLLRLLRKYNGSFQYASLPMSPNVEAYDTLVAYDATFNEQSQKAKIAAVVRIDDVLKIRTMEKNCKTIFSAEHMALDLALHFLAELAECDGVELGKILLCGDNQQLISAIYGLSTTNRRVVRTRTKVRKINADLAWVASKENLADEYSRTKS